MGLTDVNVVFTQYTGQGIRVAKGDFVAAIHKDTVDTRKEGAYPNRSGKDTVRIMFP